MNRLIIPIRCLSRSFESFSNFNFIHSTSLIKNIRIGAKSALALFAFGILLLPGTDAFAEPPPFELVLVDISELGFEIDEDLIRRGPYETRFEDRYALRTTSSGAHCGIISCGSGSNGPFENCYIGYRQERFRRIFGTELLDRNRRYVVQFPKPGNPGNTDPSGFNLPLICSFEGRVINTRSVYSTVDEIDTDNSKELNIPGPLPSASFFAGVNGVTCTSSSATPEKDGYLNGDVSCSKPDDGLPQVNYNFYDIGENGCGNTVFEFTCDFPEQPSQTVSDACGGVGDGSEEAKISWSPYLYFHQNDSSMVTMEICCCEQSDQDCSCEGNPDGRRPFLVK